MDFPKEITVAFTGYRPEKIRLSSANPDIEREIRAAAGAVVRSLYGRGFRYFLTGMAEGFDLWAADEVLGLKSGGECPDAEIVAVIPFRGQERRYPAQAAELYRKIIENAAGAIVLSEEYHAGCFQRRNDWLVGNASSVVCYFDGQPGGTQYTVSAARRAGLPVINLLNPSLPF